MAPLKPNTHVLMLPNDRGDQSEFIIEDSPIEPLHLFPIMWENCLNPVDHALEIQPNLIAVGVMLMSGHVVFDLNPLSMRDPLDRGLKVILANSGA